ncbi:RecX family transcriptional regulator [Aneurinibacillus tyrosinisolvens]|uniref:RecX family transcriptional regulator n=1 Tax=Aneurinibacillus tyrosinisolvens TaxID=1443435 RepID=UPI00063FBD81|nr:RecX family transcriptional regulator [Aneurinibacillus tyrosinisolvens]
MEKDKPSSIITRLERQKKNKGRINVYIDEEFSFALHEDVLIKYRLTKGRQLDAEEMADILQAEEKNRAEQYGLRYLGYRPRTAEEVRQYLLQKGFPEHVCSDVTAEFIEKKYLDDGAYARQWIEERLRLKPRGRNLLRQELRNRGINNQTIEHAMNGIEQEDEWQACLHIAQKKYAAVRFSSYQEMRNKVGPFLQRRGFTLELIARVLEEIRKDIVEGEVQE